MGERLKTIRAALCFSGQPRGLPEAVQQIHDNLITPNLENCQIDLFFHQWFSPYLAGLPFDSAQPGQTGAVGRWDPTTEEQLRQLPGVRGLVLEPPRDFPVEGLNTAPTADQSRLQSMFFSMWQANNLKSMAEEVDGQIYDVVVRTRIDLVYRQPVVLTNYLESIKEGIVVPHQYQAIRQHGISMVDIFAIGSSPSMDCFTSVSPHYRDLNSRVSQPYGENLLGLRVRGDCGISILMANIGLDILHRVRPQQ